MQSLFILVHQFCLINAGYSHVSLYPCDFNASDHFCLPHV